MLLKTFLQVYCKLCSFLDLRSTIFRFCVKFYPPDPALLQEEYTRYCVLFCNYYIASSVSGFPVGPDEAVLCIRDCMLLAAREISRSHNIINPFNY